MVCGRTVAKGHWRFVRRQGYGLSKGQLLRCAEGVAQETQERRLEGPAPALQAETLRQKRHFKVPCKSSAITLRDDGVLRLSNGRGEDPVLINGPSDNGPKRVDIGAIHLLTGIRERIDYGKKANQRLHQWACGEFVRMVDTRPGSTE